MHTFIHSMSHTTIHGMAHSLSHVVGVSAVMTVAKLLDLILPHTSPCRWNTMHPCMPSSRIPFLNNNQPGASLDEGMCACVRAHNQHPLTQTCVAPCLFVSSSSSSSFSSLTSTKRSSCCAAHTRIVSLMRPPVSHPHCRTDATTCVTPALSH
jgi:hypothetical protein